MQTQERHYLHKYPSVNSERAVTMISIQIYGLDDFVIICQIRALDASSSYRGIVVNSCICMHVT